jgi:hypothetical protein
MNRKQLSVVVAIAAIFSVPAFAQGGSGSGGAAAGSGTAGTPAPASTSVDVNKNTGSQGPAASGSVSTAPAAPVSSSTNTGVTSGTGVPVTSGTGVAVVPAAPLHGTAHTYRILPGSAVVPYNTTTVMGAPAAGVTSSTTTVTHSWANVPADAHARGDFLRWQSLK